MSRTCGTCNEELLDCELDCEESQEKDMEYDRWKDEAIHDVNGALDEFAKEFSNDKKSWLECRDAEIWLLIYEQAKQELINRGWKENGGFSKSE